MLNTLVRSASCVSSIYVISITNFRGVPSRRKIMPGEDQGRGGSRFNRPGPKGDPTEYMPSLVEMLLASPSWQPLASNCRSSSAGWVNRDIMPRKWTLPIFRRATPYRCRQAADSRPGRRRGETIPLPSRQRRQSVPISTATRTGTRTQASRARSARKVRYAAITAISMAHGVGTPTLGKKIGAANNEYSTPSAYAQS